MANVDFPRGFIPIRYRHGGEMICERGKVSSSNGAIGKYDLLERRADGLIHPAQAATTTLIGVAAQHLDANTGGDILYYPIEDLIMHAQSDSADIAADTDFDLLYDILATGRNATTKQSQMEIAGASKAANAALPIKILRVADIITQAGNAVGANVLVECMANAGVIKGAGLAG